MKLYLAGGIQDIIDPITWRREIASKLPEGWTAIAPIEIDSFIEIDIKKARKIVETDLKTIRFSDAVLARIDYPSWGTAMEIFYAHGLAIPIIGWNPPDPGLWGGKTTVSPWIVAHCDIITSDIKVVTKSLQNLSGEKAHA